MFTGIIEQTGRVLEVRKEGTNTVFTIESKLAPELKIDQSVSHNGVCLTVEKVGAHRYEISAIKESLERSNLDELRSGDLINLERCVQADGRFDGHYVLGHIDTTATISNIQPENGSWLLTFYISDTSLVVEKGSITINGISLTVFDVTETAFSVALIPYTFENTNMKHLKVGSRVNIEFDILGKYIQKQLENTKT